MLVFLGVTAVGALVAVVLLLRSPADGGPREERVASDSTATAPAASVAGKSVLLDVEGAVLEEFSGDCAGVGYPYLCRQVKQQLLAQDPQLLDRGGLTIRTTIDQRLQRAAQRAIDAHVHRDDPQVAAQVMIVPGEGAIRAMATSRDAAAADAADADGGADGSVADADDRAADGAAFQQGTTAMPYVLAAAFAAGLRSDDGFQISDEYRAPSYAAFRNCANQAVADPAHTVVNREKGGDRFVTLRSGTREVVNTFYMRLTEKVGLCETVRMAERLGLGRADGTPLLEFETFSLGINEVGPVSVANSYASLAARGRFCEPTVITEIRDGSGAPRPFPPRCRQVLDPAVADAVTDVLSEALAKSALGGIGREAAGMPGTTDAFTAAWYAGYTPGLASAVSLGDSRGAFQHDLSDVTIGGRHYPQVDGMSLPSLVWKEAMTEAVRGTQETGFTRPDAGRFGACRDACPN
ncbi:penicillin-binding transpeptidase domain-containing protein [Streptosporangium sp. NPDC000563]|uniref:penicillin-binding transpeptidase domain-containing protein n=1 Tax=unclassified Streptosporangium TaxID=2632669 RepID=UPI0033319A5D